MNSRIHQFFHSSVKNFFEGAVNIIIFLPYFFSVITLLKTLFSPWKNLAVKKTIRGFSMADWFNRLSFNMISSVIGLVMRSSIIVFYVLFQIVYLIFLPFIFLIYILLLPLLFLIALVSPSDEEKKLAQKKQFIATHLLNRENLQVVEQWFEHIYQKKLMESQWWKLRNLFSMPPLARDWAVGYTPILDSYATDLTNVAYQTNLKQMVGREKEIKQIEEILSKSEEANVVIVGDEGIGKHTIVDGFAAKVFAGRTNPLLAYKRILKLNMEKILTQFIEQKQREEFISELFQEAVDAKNVVLFLDNFDKFISSGQDHIDLTVPLEQFGKTSKIQIIGITTPFLYEKYVFTNEKINRIFNKVDVQEVTKVEAMQIITGMSENFERRYRVTIPYETLAATIEKSDFFITTIPFPEKAMQLLDTACVYTTQTLRKNVVPPDVIDAVLTQRTHVPTTLSANMKDKLLQLEALLATKVVHQDEAIRELSSALRRSFILLGKRKKPLASFLFLGPTGVGKTETTKAISEVFFGSQKSLIRFDMSLYQSKDDIGKLMGSMDTGNPGLLTNAIREQPYGVLLLDEIEKANRDLLNIFLTILDEGYFTDGYGKKVDCKNLVIIATSNAGADYLYSQLNHVATASQGISTSSHATALDSHLMQVQSGDALSTNSLIAYLIQNHIFSPEFLNRFDGVVAFHPLEQDSAVIIARKMLTSVTEQIFALYKVRVQVSDSTLQQLTQSGYDPAFGARNLERILRNEIEDKVAKMILEGRAKEGDVISL